MKNLEEFIEIKAKEFRKLFKIRKKIEVKKDNRMRSKVMGVTLYRYKDNNETFYLIKYNLTALQRYSKMYSVHCLLHEIGHVKAGHVGLDSKKCKLTLKIQEYQAERFALIYLKKQYPKYYKKALRELEDWSITCKDEVYRQAFAKLWSELK